MSNFSFVSNRILQSNLDLSFNHIVDLLTLSVSEQYKGKDLLVSSLRKTIIIHTASIIEALLLWKFKQICKKNRIELDNEWRYFNLKIVYSVNRSEEIIAGFRKKERRDLNRLDFLRVTDLCQKYKIIKSKRIREDIDKVREFRNRMHIGGLSELEKEYSKSDLEFCFKIAKRVKQLTSK